MLFAMHPVGRWLMILIEVPEAEHSFVIGLSLSLRLKAQAGTPCVDDEKAPARNERTYLVVPSVRHRKSEWTDERIQGVLRSAGFATTADWIARFWADRPDVTVEVAEQAFRNWLTGGGQLPEAFAPPAAPASDE